MWDVSNDREPHFKSSVNYTRASKLVDKYYAGTHAAAAVVAATGTAAGTSTGTVACTFADTHAATTTDLCLPRHASVESGAARHKHIDKRAHKRRQQFPNSKREHQPSNIGVLFAKRNCPRQGGRRSQRWRRPTTSRYIERTQTARCGSLALSLPLLLSDSFSRTLSLSLRECLYLRFCLCLCLCLSRV